MHAGQQTKPGLLARLAWSRTLIMFREAPLLMEEAPLLMEVRTTELHNASYHSQPAARNTFSPAPCMISSRNRQKQPAFLIPCIFY